MGGGPRRDGDLNGIRQYQSFPCWCVCGGGGDEGWMQGGLYNAAIQWDLIYTTDGGDYKVNSPFWTTFESRLKTCDKL